MATFVTGDGVQLFYERRGRGPRVFACHGGPANDYRYLAEDLAPLMADFEVVFCDYRGSGESQAAPQPTYTLARLADDLEELRQELGDEQIVVLGHSMGGYVALAYAVQHPDRLRRLALVGTWPTTVPRRLLPGMFRSMGWARSMKMLARTLAWMVAFSWRPRSVEGRRRAYAIWSTTQEGLAPVRAREIEREAQLGMPLSNDNIRSLQREFRSWSLSDRLPEIDCPTLVLYGDRDAAAVAGAAVFRANIKDVQTRTLADIGHDVFFEAPQASADCVRVFLAGNSAA